MKPAAKKIVLRYEINAREGERMKRIEFTVVGLLVALLLAWNAPEERATRQITAIELEQVSEEVTVFWE